MNNREKRQKEIRAVAKTCSGDVTSFEAGVKWADYHPNWEEGMPKPKHEENQYGLPMLYLCQILTLDMTFGYRYSYRVGFINSQGKWNIENENTKVTRFMRIYCNETMDQLVQKDIPKYETEKLV